MLRAGNLVQIEESAWKAYLKAKGLQEHRSPPGVRTVVRVNEKGVLLDYPMYFWQPYELKAPPSHRVMIQR